MSSETRTSPEIEALELKLTAGEYQANLGTVMKKVKVKVKLGKLGRTFNKIESKPMKN